MESAIPVWPGDNVLHPVYLPFSAGMLSRHFAPVSSPGTAEDYLRYYRENADRDKKARISSSLHVALMIGTIQAA
jgi:hypothetical protein